MRGKWIAYILTDNEESYSVRPSTVLLRVGLRFCVVSAESSSTYRRRQLPELTVCDTLHNTRNGDRSTIEHLGRHGLLAHEITV